MIKIGDYNTLKVIRFVDFGAYLGDDTGVEILLPKRYIESELQRGMSLDVFVYRDSEDRLVATTEHPLAKVGEFAFLKVIDVNNIGAFMDWGLSKNLLVPYSEQKARLRKGISCPVYIYLDSTTNRIVATAKIERFIGNKFPRYKRGDKVKVMVYDRCDIGYKAIVENLYHGLIYNSDVFGIIEIGRTMTARVNKVRDDGKIDLVPGDETGIRIRELAEKFYYVVDAAGGRSSLSDYSSPAEIESLLQCSKKDFKKALGFLFKNGIMRKDDTGGVVIVGDWETKIFGDKEDK